MSAPNFGDFDRTAFEFHSVDYIDSGDENKCIFHCKIPLPVPSVSHKVKIKNRSLF